MIYTSKYESKLGKILLASDGTNLTGLWIEGQKYFLSNIKEEIEEKELPIFKQTKLWLDKYFEGKEVSPKDLKLKPEGTEFRKEVWKILCQIPYGKTTTYKEIADTMAKLTKKKKMSAQAVGGAVGHNPISIIIPCHRVVGTDGSLTGYAGGLDKKIKLLEIEKVDMSKFYIPTTGTAL